MIIQDNPESPNLNSTYYTTPSTVATSTFASGSPMMPQEAYLTECPVSAFSFDFENPNDRRRASLGTFTPYIHDNLLSEQAVPNEEFSELTFTNDVTTRNVSETHVSSSDLLSSSNEDALSNKEIPLIDLEEYLQSNPFEKADVVPELNSDITFEHENPEQWFFSPPTAFKKERTHSPIPQKKALEFHNLSPLPNSRLRKTKSFTYASSKKLGSAGPATPLQNYVSEFHVNEGIFPIQDETASFSKQLSYSSVHKKTPSSKSTVLRRSKTSTNLCLNASPRTSREHRSMEAGLVSFQLQLNNDSKS